MKTNKLHTIENTGFKVPDDYFNTLEDRILSNLKLQEMAPKSGYKVPDHYFESLENRMSAAAIKPENEVKVITLFTRKKILYASAIAASIILMLNIFMDQTKNITADSIETASIENYIIDENLDLYEFASLFSEDELSHVELISDGYNSKNLENYVFDNLEIEDIITK
ncbi:hypothetical protein [Mariniflexile sp.]|uniref:hypothetical protein n=1 Tax=Mariniflexile sp. TaxID=1979402 RepID=UPI0040485AE3